MDKEYRLEAETKAGRLESIKEISQGEFDEIDAANACLSNGMECIDFYVICKENFEELARFFDAANFGDKRFFVEANRLFFNFVASFYSWLSFYEKTCKHCGVSEEFKVVKNSFYSENKAYRLLYGLRNYSSHAGLLPVRTSSIDLLTEEVTVWIDPQMMLSSGEKWKKQEHEDLQEYVDNGRQIDLLKFLSEASTAFEQAQIRYFGILTPNILEAISMIDRLIPGEGLQNRPHVWIIQSSTGMIVKSLDSQLTLCINKLAEEYAPIDLSRT